MKIETIKNKDLAEKNNFLSSESRKQHAKSKFTSVFNGDLKIFFLDRIGEWEMSVSPDWDVISFSSSSTLKEI